MITVLQRVREAHVDIEGCTVGQIGHGLLVLVCAEQGDSEKEADKLLAKLMKLRVFTDGAGKMNRSVQDVQGGLMIVSQFTLAADTTSGNRPSFTQAANPQEGQRLYDYLVEQAQLLHTVGPVATGVFGADMQVHLVNDGPVTIPLRMAPAV